MVWALVGAMLLGILLPVLVAGRLEGRVQGWLLRVGRDRPLPTALVVVGLFAALAAPLVVAAAAAYAIDDEVVGGAVVLAVSVPLLSVAMVFSPSSWNAPRVAEETRALRERGASKATAYAVFWVGFACLALLFGSCAALVIDLWLFRT